MKSKTITGTLTVQALVLAASSIASADDPPAAPEANPPGEDSAQNDGNNAGPPPGTVLLPAPSQPVYPGALPPPGFDPNAHLPSSSRATLDITKGDSFDLLPKNNGAASIRGGANGSYVVEGQFTPELHAVRRGDTLWDISNRYYQNPYQWPRIWGQNPQIQNPHWIYPGDRIRLREANGAPTRASVGLTQGRRSVPPQTIFLRDMGWIDDKKEDTWGELAGSPSDRMMLAEGDDVYLQLEDGHDVQIGSTLTIFRPIRTVESENAKGELVSIRGTARIDRYNPTSRMARAKVVEALDVIERGAKVGPLGRRFDVVPPTTSDRDLEAHILAAVYPNQFFGQNQVLFLDRGEKDGVKVGQRFFAVRRGDRWIQNIRSAGALASQRPRVEDDRPAKVDSMRTNVDEDLLPDETYAEVRVLRVRAQTSTALVVASKHEIERNARLVSRKGF